MKNAVLLTALIVGLTTTAAGVSAQVGLLPPGGSAGVGGATEPDPAPARLLYVIDPHIPIPSNGAILIQGEDSAPLVDVHAEGSTDVIAGAVTHVALSFWSWKPDEPLSVGNYTVTFPSERSGTDSIRVVEAIELEPPAMTSAPEALWIGEPSELLYCKRWTGFELVDDSAFAAKERGRIVLVPHLATMAAREHLHQFLFRAFMIEGDLPYHLPFNTEARVGPWAKQADQYCFGFESMDIATGTVRAYPELTPTCIAHGALPSLSEREVSVPDAALDRLSCQAPPAGHEERWCEINRVCEQIAPEARTIGGGCIMYGHVCEGEEVPAPPEPIMGGMNGGAVPPDMSTAGMAAVADQDAQSDVVERSGCSVGLSTREAPGTAVVLFALAALYVPLRRHAHRRRARVLHQAVQSRPG